MVRRTTSMKTEPTHSHRSGPLWLVVASFATVYVIWGSTYLGIRFAVESIPPFLMAGSRYLVAGLILLGFARRQGGPRPSRREWRHAAIAGGLMLTIGNGGVTWAEQTIPSGVTALLIALTPMWMVLFDWLRPTGVRPGPLVIVGLVVGFVGVALLARGQRQLGDGAASSWGIAAIMAASIGWALGTVFNRGAQKPASPFLAVAMQMIAGGVLLLGAAVATGEVNQFSPAQMTLQSFGAWLYLMVAGSLIAYTAYIWLLHATSAARVSTTAYVNPLIAVLLGCTIGREPFSQEILMAATLIIVAVALVLRGGAVKAATPIPCEEVA